MGDIFIYEDVKLNVINVNDIVWFKAKVIANILEYTNTRKAIRDHVEPEDKTTLNDIKSLGNEKFPLINGHMMYINESGLYSLIIGSKMEKAKEFKRCVTKDVIPSIRKTGKYEKKKFKMLAYTIESEYDLHSKVVNYIRNHYTEAIMAVSLGENQINSNMRIRSYNMGYQNGAPDMVIQNFHLVYPGFVIEFKTPKGNGQLSDNQRVMLQKYKLNGYKILVSNDYDEIITEIIKYFYEVRIKCEYCYRTFKSQETLDSHLKHIHKILK